MSISTDQSDAFVVVHRETSPSILSWFEVEGSESFPWSQTRIQRVADARQRLGGALFFDELVNLAGLDASSLYPPNSIPDLNRLLTAIEECAFDKLKKDCLIYYLLRDFDSSSSSQDKAGAARSQSFAEQVLLLSHFRDVADGYWLLDQGDYDEAIPYLTRPDFVPKVLAALFPIPVSAAASVTEERWTPAARAALLLKFLRTARPPLNTPEDLERQVESLCWVRGVAEAWALVRKFGDEEKLKERLVWRVLEHCFSPTPKAKPIQALLCLPLSESEEALLEAFCFSPPVSLSSTSAAVAADILLVRYINSGRYVDAVRLDRRLNSAGAPGVLATTAGAAAPALLHKLKEKRAQMIRGALAILPEVQRSLLGIEMGLAQDEDAPVDEGESGTANAARSSTNGVNGDIQMSWESVEAPDSAETFFRGQNAGSSLPLSASPALRQSNMHGSDPQRALLQAVVRSSPGSADGSPRSWAQRTQDNSNSPLAARTISPATGSPARRADSMDRNASPRPVTPVSGPSTPAFARRQAAQNNSGTLNLTSQSPFAGPPRLSPRNTPLGSSTPLNGLPRGSPLGLGGSTQTPVRAQHKPFAYLQRSTGAGSPHYESSQLSFSGSPYQPSGRYELASSHGSASAREPFGRSSGAGTADVPWGTEAPMETDMDVAMTAEDADADREGSAEMRNLSAPATRSARSRRGAQTDATPHRQRQNGSQKHKDERSANAKSEAVSVPGAFPGHSDDVEPDQPSSGAASSKTKTRTTALRSRRIAQSNGAGEATNEQDAGRRDKVPEPPRKRMTKSTSGLGSSTQLSDRKKTTTKAASGPTARRTRAQTAELEAEAVAPEASGGFGDTAEAAEEGDALGSLPAPADVGRKTGGGKRTSVRRSSRLASSSPEPLEAEQANTPAPRTRRAAATRTSTASSTAEAGEELAPGVKTRGGKRTMPGGLSG